MSTSVRNSAPIKHRKHAYKDELHHPFVEVMQHLISPLTASLTIFMIHKKGQLPALKAWLRSLRVRAAAGSAARRRAEVVPSNNPMAPVQTRQYSTYTRNSGGLWTSLQLSNTGFSLPSPSSHLTSRRQLHSYPFGVRLSSTSTTPASSTLLSTPNKHLAAPAQPTGTWRPVWERMKTLLAPSAGAHLMTNAAMADPTATAAASEASMPAVEAASVEGIPGFSATILSQLEQIYSPEDATMVAQHLSNWWSVKQVENSLYWIHDTMHLPWWGTIIVVTLALRFVLMPVNIALLRNSLRMKLIAPQINHLQDQMKASTSPDEKLDFAMQISQSFKDNKCHPLKNFLTFPIILPPAILSIFGAIHNLSMSEPSMAVEGALFFPDLVQADPTNLLPIASAFSWLMNVESGAGVYYHSSPYLKSLIRVTACMAWALSSTMPSGVLIFWTTSNMFAIARGYITRFDNVRKRLNIPLQSEIAKLQHLPAPSHF